jgi:predicted aspartyl protease
MEILMRPLSPKFKALASLLPVIVLMSACNYVKNINLLTSGSLDREDFVQTIPFDYKKDLIVVKAKINGRQEKRQFIFDTGAFDSKIEIGLADKLNLHTKASKTNSTAQGISQKIEVTQLESIELGETVFTDISAGKLRYDEHSASQCIAPHGIIGANLTKLAHWKIDYHNREIQFSDNPVKRSDKEYYSLDFDKPMLSGTPEIEIKVGGKMVLGVLFDTGYNGGLILPARLADSFPAPNERIYFDRSTSGIFGTNTDTLTSKQLEVSIGGYAINIPVAFSSIGKALLGNDILEHFEVFIDYDQNRIELHPVENVQVDSPYAFIPGILNDSLWVVNRTSAKLPFSLGDTLQSINGKKPADLYNSFCDYFLNINKLLDTGSLSITAKNGTAIKLNAQN